MPLEFRLTCVHPFRLQADPRGGFVAAGEPLAGGERRFPQDLGWREEVVLEEFTLDARYGEAERFDGPIGEPLGLGELDGGHVALVLGQEAETLGQRGTLVMGQGTDEGGLLGDLVAVDGGVALAGREDRRAVLVVERDEDRRRDVQADHAEVGAQVGGLVHVDLPLGDSAKEGEKEGG